MPRPSNHLLRAPRGGRLVCIWRRCGCADAAVPEADVERFAGDNRHVVDYLSEVVLDQLGDEAREFLLDTSIVDRLCSSLCEAITNRPAGGVLEEIARSNVFLVPLDDTRTWYRYHHLFAEMLRSELARRHPDRVAVLHRRASAWYRDRGLISDAIEHATSAGDYDDAAELISEYWLEVGRWGQEATLRRWLQAFAPDELQRHPELGVIGAFLTGVSGGPEIEFRRWLELAERGIAHAEQNRSPGVDAVALRRRVQQLGSSFGYRNIRTAAATAARAARVESEGDGALRVAALANLAFLLYLSGDPTTARQVLSEAIRDPLAQRRPYGFIIALTTSALIALDEGDADNGRHAAARALEFAAAAGLAENQVSALAHVAFGRALTATGRPDSARTEIERGVRLLRGGVMAAQQIYALLWAAPAAQATGDLPSALAYDRRSRRTARVVRRRGHADNAASRRPAPPVTRPQTATRPRLSRTDRSRARRAPSATQPKIPASDRAGTIDLNQHRQDAHLGDLPQTRCRLPRRCDRPGHRTRPAVRAGRGSPRRVPLVSIAMSETATISAGQRDVGQNPAVDPGGARLLLGDVGIAALLLNEARRRVASRMFGVSEDQALLVTLVAAGLLAGGARNRAARVASVPSTPSLGDSVLVAGVLKEAVHALAGDWSKDTPLFTTLVAIAMLGTLARPVLKISFRDVKASSHASPDGV